MVFIDGYLIRFYKELQSKIQKGKVVQILIGNKYDLED